MPGGARNATAGPALARHVNGRWVPGDYPHSTSWGDWCAGLHSCLLAAHLRMGDLCGFTCACCSATGLPSTALQQLMLAADVSARLVNLNIFRITETCNLLPTPFAGTGLWGAPPTPGPLGLRFAWRCSHLELPTASMTPLPTPSGEHCRGLPLSIRRNLKAKPLGLG